MSVIDVAIIIFAVGSVAGTVVYSVRNKKKGKSCCGYDCANCKGCSSCKERKEE